MDNTSFTHILAIDIGGSNIKATILDREGALQFDYKKLPTPEPSTPENVLKTIQTLLTGFPGYDRISVGFPGYVKGGVIKTAPNLGSEFWKDINFAKVLSDSLGKPVRLVNDADMQGLGVVEGKGFEMAITLGTGFGSAFLLNGHLLPHLEIAHHPVSKRKTYDEYLGDLAMEEVGDERWNTRVQKVIGILKTVFNYDRLYISGGNARKINFTLDENIKIVSNRDGIKGGARLWLKGELAL